jgi:predicted DNA-binding protein (MmcQ/YjbR family)
MDIEKLREYCLSLPKATEDVKWGNDLCFCLEGKMFCVTSLTAPHSTSFKVSDEEFATLTDREGVIPAPYMARHKWVMADDLNVFKDKEWKSYIKESYEMIKAKLPAKLRNKI